MKDICIHTNENTEMLVKIGQILGNAGVNIEGLSLTTIGSDSAIHFAVEDEHSALKALTDADIEVLQISDVYIFDKDHRQVTGKPGSFGEICKSLKNNDIQIIFGYPAENNRFVFGVDDIEKAKQVLG